MTAMKKIFAAVAILAISSLVSAQAGSGIRSSAHDFTNKSWNTQRQGEICGVCHIPHVEGRTSAQTGNGLLWGRSLSQQTNYTLYSSPTLVGSISQPDGSTKLCLGCHDGSVFLEHFGGNTTTGSKKISGSKMVPGLPIGGPGTDFSNSHPVSIVYVPGNTTSLRALNSPFGSGTIQDALEESPPNSGTYKVQCRTCHDVHNKDVPTGAKDLLRIRNDDPTNPSALCLACHDK
jgi:hypothetical protein